MKERLDIALAKRGITETRSKAQQLIKGGYVVVDGKVCKKSGFMIEENSIIEIKDSPFIYVGRAGVKLKHAIEYFKLDIKNSICLDIGASTGGFSDCMLKENALKVYAVDVGVNQLHKSLREDNRVVLFENTDIRDFKIDILFDFIAVDVSFISLSHILPHIKRLIKKGGYAVVLIKPQFEVGPNMVKKGIVKNKKAIQLATENIKSQCYALGFDILGITESPILGKDGNREFLICCFKK